MNIEEPKCITHTA